MLRASRETLTLSALLIVYGAGVGIAFCLVSDWTARQTWAVVLTGFVIIWYTWETMLLRKASMAQRELSLRPFVVFRGVANGYSLENVGNATALDIRISPISIEGEGIQLDISFPSAVPLLQAGEPTDIDAQVKLNGKVVDGVFAAHLDPNYAVHSLDVHIKFRSIEGRPYELIQTVAPKTLEIQGFRGSSAF